ncbi:hypothetical protein CROQUDRAFT_588749 [Cronartium quercuum f. sp. fusiforme G11]|uniref:Xrn1 N-terminal domain-containing protein n=1 Tax=Cronartium quercuum f. sp. fusiforme G11 TaxID=708437 RepID=A0A9P6NJA3_9BASI|nr:hypothetical protein CROQUDRAFT_588749 [Cronartium quercuum f. sp. fusiforme G11]
MGVPALFRWLSKKYPKIVEQVREDLPNKGTGAGGLDGSTLDMSKRNPNGVEFGTSKVSFFTLFISFTH